MSDKNDGRFILSNTRLVEIEPAAGVTRDEVIEALNKRQVCALKDGTLVHGHTHAILGRRIAAENATDYAPWEGFGGLHELGLPQFHCDEL
jgi:hypothetical protein